MTNFPKIAILRKVYSVENFAFHAFCHTLASNSGDCQNGCCSFPFSTQNHPPLVPSPPQDRVKDECFHLIKCLPMITVKKLLDTKSNQEIWAVRPDQMVIEALEVMAEANIGAVLVMDGDRLVGIFSERDYARKGIIHGRKAQKTPVAEIMKAETYPVSPEMDIEDCMELLADKPTRHLPVVAEGRVIGLLSIGDIVTTLVNDQTVLIEHLEHYISH